MYMVLGNWESKFILKDSRLYVIVFANELKY